MFLFMMSPGADGDFPGIGFPLDSLGGVPCESTVLGPSSPSGPQKHPPEEKEERRSGRHLSQRSTGLSKLLLPFSFFKERGELEKWEEVN